MFEEIVDACHAGGITFTVCFVILILSTFLLFFTLLRFRFLEIDFIKYLKKEEPDLLEKYQENKTWLKIIRFTKVCPFEHSPRILKIKRNIKQWDLIGKLALLSVAVSFVMIILSIIMMEKK